MNDRTCTGRNPTLPLATRRRPAVCNPGPSWNLTTPALRRMAMDGRLWMPPRCRRARRQPQTAPPLAAPGVLPPQSPHPASHAPPKGRWPSGLASPMLATGNIRCRMESRAWELYAGEWSDQAGTEKCLPWLPSRRKALRWRGFFGSIGFVHRNEYERALNGKSEGVADFFRFPLCVNFVGTRLRRCRRRRGAARSADPGPGERMRTPRSGDLVGLLGESLAMAAGRGAWPRCVPAGAAAPMSFPKLPEWHPKQLACAARTGHHGIDIR